MPSRSSQAIDVEVGLDLAGVVGPELRPAREELPHVRQPLEPGSSRARRARVVLHDDDAARAAAAQGLDQAVDLLGVAMTLYEVDDPRAARRARECPPFGLRML